MRSKLLSLLLALCLLAGLLPAAAIQARAAEALPAELLLEPSEANELPAAIRLIKTTDYDLYLPGNADPAVCRLSWEGGLNASFDGAAYPSGTLPIPAPGETETYTFTLGSSVRSFTVTTWQGSAQLKPVFMEIDESQGTIAAMNNDPNHNTECHGLIYIDGEEFVLDKMKGRGNYAWSQSKDKRAYNVNLGKKAAILGMDVEKTKKYSFLANVCDHSLLRDKVGYDLGYALGIAPDSASCDVWMNGVYQGVYLVTPKTDSYISDDGYLLENDNNREPAISAGGDPSFTLIGLKGSNGSDSDSSNGDNRITVKKIGDNLLLDENGEPDESVAKLNAVTQVIKAWTQDTWDAIRSPDGYNSKGIYYADYIDLTSFAKMYLVLEYCKDYDVCAGSKYFQRFGTAEGDKFYAMPVWDLDTSLGATQENGGLRLNADISMTTGYGFFIRNIYDYRTSIYKALGQHEDFMDEVLEVYQANKAAFDAIPGKVDAFSAEIVDSAMMNFNKVDPVDNYNVARYTRDTVKNAGTPYEQHYYATTNSKTDWPVYVRNLRTYCEARTRFFEEYMVESYSNPVLGEAGEDLAPSGAVYSDYTASWENLNGINDPSFEPASSNMGIGLGWGNWYQDTGSEHYVGFRWDSAVSVNAIELYWYDDNGGTRVPSDFHLEYKDESGVFRTVSFAEPISGAKALNQYNRLSFPTVTTQDLRLVMTTASNASGIYRFKVCSAVELPGIPVVFHTTSKAQTAVYETQDFSGEGTVAEYAFARDSLTGELDSSGNGQVNFRVLPAEGYRVEEVLAEPAENYKNLKGPEDTGAENVWRITKITDRVDVTVKVTRITEQDDPPAPPCEHEFDEEGVCVLCGEAVPRVSFVPCEHASVTAFDTQDLTGAGRPNAAFALARSSADGSLALDGDGQVNFVVVPEPGWLVRSVSAEPAECFKNLKGPEELGAPNAWRLTKLSGDCSVTLALEPDPDYVPPEPPAPPFLFDDVRDESAYYYKPVYWAVHHKPQITSGVSDTLFGPKEPCTRGQVMTFLYHAAGNPEVENPVNPFVDVTEGKYYYRAVLWACSNGITSGKTPERFAPNDSCTRAQIVTFLYSFAGKPPVDASELPFEDVKPTAYYRKAVAWALENGITSGKSETRFAPNDTCTRAEVVTFLYKLLANN